MQNRPSEGQAGLHPGGVPADVFGERMLDPEVGGRCSDPIRHRSFRDPVELGGIGQVVPSGETVVEGWFGRDDATVASHSLAIDGGVAPEGDDLAPVRC